MPVGGGVEPASSWGWAGGAGAVVAGWLAYLGARWGARAGQANADKAIFVQHVTAERAVWRESMRQLVVELTTELRRAANSPGRAVKWGKVHAARAGIVLRLNPSCRETGAPGDKHELDRAVFVALQSLVSARHQANPEWLAKADTLEEAAQRLIKKEWDRSKKEARTGRIEE